jgi:DNA-binding transcriptional ArsR family regulator
LAALPAFATQVTSAANEMSAVVLPPALSHIQVMTNAPHIAEVGALVGDPARANMLVALLGGRALTATELAYAAGVSPQTTSGHLGKLFAARLLVQMKQGRHRYYRLAGPHVAQMLESIMNVALTGPPRFQPRTRLDEKLRHARTCYDHIAGVLGVGLAECMTAREFVVLGEEAGEVTPSGMEFFSQLGVDLSAAKAKRRVFCRPCLDWTERRSHIGGAVGAALAQRLIDLKWIERARDSRALSVTPIGRRGLTEHFALSL